MRSGIAKLTVGLLCLFPLKPLAGQDMLAFLENHYRQLINRGKDVYGDLHTPVWMSSIDPSVIAYPANDRRPENIPPRVYLDRSVDAPKGATLYWDLPDIAAAYQLSKVTGNSEYRLAAEAYVAFIMTHCLSKNGVILWGNHYYYDAFQDQCVRFKSSETPIAIDPLTETGDLHEMRPISPPWDLLWEIDSMLIKKHIEALLDGHIINPSTGEFNRHANGESGYAFLEYGGILVYTLSQLYRKTGEESLLETASSIIDFSDGSMNESTGLMENSPTVDRWDKYTSTTEIGLWGNYIIKATAGIPENLKEQWINKVDKVVSNWLRYGFDHDKQQFYGGLNVADGKPYMPDSDYPYQPGYYAGVWNPLFPTHNYPMQLAECCLMLYQVKGSDFYRKMSDQWLRHIQTQMRTRARDQLLYAENYARQLHYLMKYDQVFDSDIAKDLSGELISEAMRKLYLEEHRFFRSHTGEMRCDAVDGIGLLSLVLLWHITGEEPEACVYFF